MSHFRRIVYAVLLVWAGMSVAGALGQTTSIPAAGPDATAVSFYNWYLHELAANHDPLTDDRKRIKTYVSAPLLREIKRRMSSPDGMDADYFIQAQDYLNEWIDHVGAEATKTGAANASTIIALGEPKKSPYRLSVTLALEAGLWKIRSVRRVRGNAPGTLPPDP